MSSEFSALLILLVPFAGAALVPLLNLLSPRIVPAFAVLVGLASAVIAFFLPFGMKPGVYFSYEVLPGVFKTGLLLDTLSIVPALIATWIGFLVLIYSIGYMKKEENLSRYYSLVLLFIGSMVGMSLSDNFLSLFFFWEVMGVCSYLLIGFFYADPKAAAAGVKAFIVTRIGDVALFGAILILYVLSGSFEISANLAYASKIGLPLLTAISFGFIVGAVGKSAQVPLHVWLPDAMEAPTTISALIHAATMVNAGVYLLARVHPLLAQVPVSVETLQWIGAITALLGAFLATFNNDLKRILAYSTVSQLGYMVFAIGVGGVFASQFHLFSHAIFKALLFLCAGAVIHELGTRDVREMGGLNKEMPLTGMAFFVGALALMGLPLFNGFFSKDMILEQAYEHNSFGPLSLAVIAAVLTAFYSLRTTAMVFWGQQRNTKHVHEAPASMTTPLVILSIGAVFSWLLIGRITASWSLSGFEGEIIGWKALAHETFVSKAFMMTAGAIIAGYLMYMKKTAIGNFLGSKLPVVGKSAGIGLGFDAVYGGFVAFVYGFAGFARNIWEEYIMEGINKVTGAVAVLSSLLARKMQTGDIHWNLVYIVITLIILLGMVL
ncbi:MAG TPA: NADH-quinone oxidoreductase subunit L [Elusimicrobia bacterium]|nr:MAG: hypothetical protein A2278_06700 [Elusimicrobia bacterium RIFOXYA12_FULL_49_49]OGS16266.1 MAG: hypothetical protein A2251_01485 [Elusimicrobia bacterium RIFOXYA2_FULL_47_53]OGS26191.1 MAG: hypothetical protein A2339_02610 [Elusimicrobia bacterium RIFOXYB12_FULL_50_12]OGS31421.1 MAG: hypothetical protein A2323_09775 [Elusimicrobia bacterium RIFOXYB2_FULL_46_23]HBU70038.1 NADH-quinone oxidoreductase subunit L [Elusimicrobiota bacterium]